MFSRRDVLIGAASSIMLGLAGSLPGSARAAGSGLGDEVGGAGVGSVARESGVGVGVGSGAGVGLGMGVGAGLGCGVG